MFKISLFEPPFGDLGEFTTHTQTP